MVKVQAKVMDRRENGESAYKGTVRVVLGEALSMSVMVMQEEWGPSISFPSYYLGIDQGYNEIISPVTKEAYEAITGTALKAFSEKSGKAELEGDVGLSVTKAYATYLADYEKAGIGIVVVGDCLRISGISIYEKGDAKGGRPADYFVSLPAWKGEKDGKEKYHPYAYPLTTKLASEIEAKMTEAVEESRKQAQIKEIDQEQLHRGKGR